MTHDWHPAAEVFPLMNPHDLETLTADIADNGLREPIVLLDGKVLDGRNRLRACGSISADRSNRTSDARSRC